MARRDRRGEKRGKGFRPGPRPAPAVSDAAGPDPGPSEQPQVFRTGRPHILVTYLLGFFMSALVLGPICVIAAWVFKLGPQYLKMGAEWSAFSGLLAALVLSCAAAGLITFFANRQFIDQRI